MRKKISNKQYAKALYEASKDAPENKSGEIARRFLAVLRDNNKLKRIDRIIEEFTAYAKKQEGILELTVESKEELPDKTVNKIRKIFEEETEVAQKINEDILGGIRIIADDTVYDYSLRTQLNKLKEKLTQ